MNDELRVAALCRKPSSLPEIPKKKKKKKKNKPTKKNPVKPREAGIDSPQPWSGKIHFIIY